VRPPGRWPAAPTTSCSSLESGYASHEAFSRAFKARFGQTPEDVRKAQYTDGLNLVDAHPHLESKPMTLKERRIQQAGTLLFVGLSKHVPFKAVQTIAGRGRVHDRSLR
jgi:AraC family transcriptional regulator